MTEGPGGEPRAGGQPGSADPAVHVVAWVDTVEARADLEAWLTQQGLAPRIQWSTSTSVSYRLGTTDTNAADEALRARDDLSWTVVAPGQADYVLRHLYVEGPDGRRFRFIDVPSATAVDDIAHELLGQYPNLPGADRPTVVDHLQPDSSRRMDPDATLAAEGIEEGSRLRVAYQTHAG